MANVIKFCENPACTITKMSKFDTVVSVLGGLVAAVFYRALKVSWADLSIQKLQEFIPISILPSVFVIFVVLLVLGCCLAISLFLAKHEHFNNPWPAFIYGAALPNLILDILGVGSHS